MAAKPPKLNSFLDVKAFSLCPGANHPKNCFSSPVSPKEHEVTDLFYTFDISRKLGASTAASSRPL
jgi:hypothetical protein